MIGAGVSAESARNHWVVESELPVPDLAVRLLGGAAIEQSGLPLADRAAHRHALALLALLATARGRLLTRDKVVALLWPEGDPETVRHRLNVLIYELRRIVGRKAIISVNDSLWLDADVVWVDIVQFATALQRGAADEAFALYRGAFMDGFHLPDAREFDEWSAGERERLEGELRRILEHHALGAERRSEHGEAARLWRRLVHLDPLGASPTMGLMRALAASGDLHAAQAVAAAHGIRREEQVGVGPDAAVDALARSLGAALPSAVVDHTPAASPLPRGAARDAVLPAIGLVSATGSLPGASPADTGVAPSRRRTRRRLAVVLALAAVLLLVFWPRLRGDRTAAAGSNRSAATDVVIFPFAVHGGDAHAYLADGMAELLSITLDGAGSFRTADPHAVLAFVRRHPGVGRDPTVGPRVAAQFGATQFVLGTVVETGGRLDLRASLYGADGRLRASAVGSVGPGADLASVVDSLSRQLIVSLYPSGVERLTRLAVATSASLPALKAFLEGESRARVGDHTAAVEAFRRATQADSSFALAWYRLAVALESTLLPRDAAAAADRAVRHSARLPERDRALLEGWQAYAAGRADDAEATYRRILDRYPNEVEAWLQLGEIGFHHAASRGQRIAVARPSFERVLALDPDHEAAHVHLARIAGQSRDVATLIRHADYLIAKRPGSGVALEMRALRAFATGDTSAVASLRPAFQREDSYTVLATLMNQFHAGDQAGMEWCADLLRERERPVEVRTAGHIVRALLDLSRGDRTAALATVAKAESLDAARGLEARALIVTAPFVEFDSVEAVRVRAALSEMTASVPESFFLPDPDRVRPLMRRYLLGLLHAQLGDPRAAIRMAEELEREPSPAADRSLGADLSAGVRAEISRLRGDRSGALAMLERIKERPTYQLVLPSPFEPRLRERFVRATLLHELGRTSEARALYAVIGARSLYDLPYARVKR